MSDQHIEKDDPQGKKENPFLLDEPEEATPWWNDMPEAERQEEIPWWDDVPEVEAEAETPIGGDGFSEGTAEERAFWGEGFPEEGADVASLWDEESLEKQQGPREAREEDFSALKLRDRVVIMLLFDQIVREEDVLEAWNIWKSQSVDDRSSEPLWRVLTLFPELDQELVFAEAARVYGFEEARIVPLVAINLMRKTRRLVGRDLWKKLMALRVIPVSETEQAHSNRPRIVFATQDPTHPEVHRLLPHLNLSGFELQYAPGGQIRELLAEAFPQYAHLKTKRKNSDTGKFEVFEANMAIADPRLGATFEEEEAPDDEQASPMTSTSIKEVFEEALVKAVQEGASDICIIPTVGGVTEVYFQIGDDLIPWTLASGFAPSSLITMVRTEVLRVKRSKKGEIQKRDVQRWINGERVRFRVILLPPSEKMHMESIVIRLDPTDD